MRACAPFTKILHNKIIESTHPIKNNIFKIFFLAGGAITANESGIHRGHIASAKNKKIYGKIIFSGYNQTNPSLACWMANSAGMLAKIYSDFLRTTLYAITAVIDKNPAAVKLALAEKHISNLHVCLNSAEV